MHDQISKYSGKMAENGSSQHGDIAFAAKDDIIISGGSNNLAKLASDILQCLNCLAVAAATPSLQFADFLIQRGLESERLILPRDTETRTFLHDIPFLRRSDVGPNPADSIARLLGNRKGVVVEGTGIIAAGALTVEQAYINWSSVYHSTYIKYLEDVLEYGFILSGERDYFRHFREELLPPLSAEGLEFRHGPIYDRGAILAEICRAGRYTVERGLVDSFFGNISYSNGELIFISQTASSLDELSGCIDPVPFENSSTVGITASSELVAHRNIYEQTGCRAILHGHPRFAVVMSMICEEKENCQVSDCWKDCSRVRYTGGTPVVAGEIGAGGLAKNVAPVIGDSGAAIVYGHGVFSIGETNFESAFRSLVDVENRCREEYFRRVDKKWGHHRQ